MPELLEKLNVWNATVVSKEGSSAQLSVVSVAISPTVVKQL